MARAFGFKVALVTRVDSGAQRVHGFGLAGAGDVVELAFHRQQRGAADVLRAHALGHTAGGRHVPGAVDQIEVLEHDADGVEVIGRVHVEYGVVFVIKLAVRFGAGVVALHQVCEVVEVAVRVAVRVHGDKAAVLQKAGVDAPTRAGEAVRHAVNHVVLKPFVALVHCQVVDRRGRFACVDGAAHHGHGPGRGFAPAGHQRHGGQHRHRGLAYAHHVAVTVFALQVADEILHIVDVIVQRKMTFAQRHQAGVFPVGDVDLMALQHGFDGVAQQRGVVARQGGDDQHGGLRFHGLQRGRVVGEAFEADQIAKGAGDFNALLNRHIGAAHIHRVDAEFGLFVVFTQAVHQIQTRRHSLAQRARAPGRAGVGIGPGGSLGEARKGLDKSALGLVNLVEHGIPALKNVAVQYNSFTPNVPLSLQVSCQCFMTVAMDAHT